VPFRHWPRLRACSRRPAEFARSGVGLVAQGLARSGVGLVAQALAFLLATWLVAEPWCGRDAKGWYAGDSGLVLKLARTVSRSLDASVTEASFTTGSQRFDGEWAFGTHVMAAMGFGQIVLAHPERAAEFLPRMDACIDRLLAPAARRFDRDAWHEDALDSLAGDQGHVAYLGYLNLVLSLRQRVLPDSRHAALNRDISAALARRFEASSELLLETYPGETYPVDNSLAIASLGLFESTGGGRERELVKRWTERCRRRWLDPRTHLLYQSMSAGGAAPLDSPRGSGTALAAYALGYADPSLSRALHEAIERELGGGILGFALRREYPRGFSGRGDIDSGPLILGYSISATGFELGVCRAQRNAACFRSLYATLHLVGAPLETVDGFTFASGGPLADAIMLAMLTAPDPGLLERSSQTWTAAHSGHP
jgi:hypothetical protein